MKSVPLMAAFLLADAHAYGNGFGCNSNCASNCASNCGPNIPGFSIPSTGDGTGYDGITGSPALTSAQYYASICPDLHEKTREYKPGYIFRFYCNAYGPHNGRLYPAKTPVECAQLCENSDGCEGSTWLADKRQCVLQGGLPSGSRDKTIYMKRVTDELDIEEVDPFAQGYERELEQCIINHQLEELQAINRLNECQEGNLNAKQEFEASLTQCQAGSLQAQQRFDVELATCREDRIKEQHASQEALRVAKQKCYDEHQAISLQLKQQKEQNLKDVKDAEERLKQQRAQNLKDQENAASQLKQCKDQALEEQRKLQSQIDTLTSKPGLYVACPETGPTEHKKTVNYSGTRYTVECAGYFELAGNRIIKEVYGELNVGACADECTKVEKCTHAAVELGARRCILYNGDFKAGHTIRRHTKYNSMRKV